MTEASKLGSVSDMLRATTHAGVTVCNRDRDRESGLPKCLPLPGDPRSNFHRLILLCHSNPVWFQYRRWNCSPIPPLVVKTIGTKSIPRCWHRSLYLLVFVSSAALPPAFGLRKDAPHAPAPAWLTAVGFTMLTSKATLQVLLKPGEAPQTCPSHNYNLSSSG